MVSTSICWVLSVTASTRHQLPLGEEIERARLALELAASGKTTALVSSGDIGIYAMASLVFELLDLQQQSRRKPS